MKWFLGGFAFVMILLFSLGIFTEKFKDREKNDPELHAKMEKWRAKWNPKITFFENLLGWIFAMFVIYYIFLG